VLFVVLFWIIPVEEVIQALLTTDLVLFSIGTALGILAVFLTAVQMEPLVRNQGIKRNILQLFSINMAVKFYLQFTPTTLVGSGIRWYRIGQPEGKIVESFVALTFFRILETFLTLTMGLGFFLISAKHTLKVSAAWVIVMILVIIMAWILITRYSLPIYNWIKSHTNSLLNQHYLQAFLKGVEKILNSVSAYSSIPATDLLLSVISGTISALAGITSGVILANAIGINLAFLDMGWIQSIVYLASQLPFAVAGGLGVREVTLVALLSTFGISAERALALSFLIFIRGILIALLGGVGEAIDALLGKHTTKLNVFPNETNKS
jgi:uncharacterized protein (TIRG00374 family)